MSAEKRAPIRFGLLTALVWLAVAAGSIFILWQVITRISANDVPAGTSTPDQTQVYQTIAAIVNANITLSPTVVATQTASPLATVFSPQISTTPIPSPKITPSIGPVTQTSTPMSLCDQAGAGNPIDITIPDDTVVAAGQSFIKTWKLVNVGTCTWTTAYAATFFYGDRMGAPEAVPLKGYISPSQTVEISVEMVAPQSSGTYQGNWKLANPAGELFGIGPNGNNSFWVRIVVAQNQTILTSTPTQSVTSNPSLTPTATSTPPGQVSGDLSPIPGDRIDLDTLTLNSGDEDLMYAADENGYHLLSPQGGALLGVFGNTEPSLASCQSAAMSTAPIAVESLPVGTHLCYTTNHGRFGRALFAALDPNNFALSLNLLTWAQP